MMPLRGDEKFIPRSASFFHLSFFIFH